MQKQPDTASQSDPDVKPVVAGKAHDTAAPAEQAPVASGAVNDLSQQLGQSNNATIMIVDDEPIIVETLQMFLEDAGYANFVTTNEAKKGVALVAKTRPDVLLLDLMMPEVNGMEILEQIRAEQALKHIPVIILTSATDSETKLKALELGATDFLGKPVDASELALRLRNTLAAKAYQDRLMYYDALTGLPNRRLFMERLSTALKRAKHDSSACAVLHIDLDRFKQINDTLGHNVGDALLKAAAARIEECVRYSDLVGRPGVESDEGYLSRFGGDEFTLFIPKIERLENATLVARRILSVLAKPFRLNNRELFITASIGIAVYPSDGDTMDTLLKHADVAMSHAKQRGRNNYQYYAKELNARSVERLSLENHLRKAMERRELFLVFQPQADVKTGEIIGAEALLRWKHPKWGLVPPGKFIPIAEEMDLIVPFGEWALYAACKLNKRWQSQGHAIRISVNVSSKQFDKGDRLMLTIRNALESTGLEGKYLGLELTESVIMENSRENARILQAARDMGVTVSIDDFGTGYSSLSNLRRFPLNELKIDRSFLKEIPDNADDAAIVAAIIAMAHSLELKIVAEGVERPEQLEFLKARGCDDYQGNFLAKPLMASDFLAMLAGAKETVE